jgi:hypothetical protein
MAGNGARGYVPESALLELVGARNGVGRPSGVVGDRFAEANRLLTEFANLQPNWDSHGGDSPTCEALRLAHDLLAELERLCPRIPAGLLPPFHLCPTPQGGILLEWKASENAIEVWIDAGGALGHLLDRGTDAEPRYEEVQDESLAQAARQIADLLGPVPQRLLA